MDNFPRDANGYLKVEVWKLIEEYAKTNPNTNEARSVTRRAEGIQYLAKYAGWVAPQPPAPPSGKLRNLAEKPVKPRFLLTGKSWPRQGGEASVCLWEDDKLAAMSLGIDDNCSGDVEFWKGLSKKYGQLNITWNLVVKGIDTGKEANAGTWNFWRALTKEGYHVASHSVTHCSDPVPADGWLGYDWEASESKRLMDANLDGFVTKVFVYPGAGVGAFATPRKHVEIYRQAAGKYYAAARGGGAFGINQANMIDYLDIHSTTGGVESLLSDTPNPAWMADQKIKNLFDPNNKCYRGWANIFIHFINQGKDFDTNPYDIAYGKLLAFYNDHREDLWTGFFDDVALYGQERDTATLVTDEASSRKIALTLTSRMDPSVFNYPLTVKVRLYDTWRSITATQDGNVLPVQMIEYEDHAYALVKAAPDRGQVILMPK
ncbi:hypothetical protein EON83_12810 [bacterium]|nr:MAG: hypothetical protein EON83_12810 [bacterium]